MNSAVTAVLVVTLVLAVWLAFPARGLGRRTRRALERAGMRSAADRRSRQAGPQAGSQAGSSGPHPRPRSGRRPGPRSPRGAPRPGNHGRRTVPGLVGLLTGEVARTGTVPMTAVVQQLAALLKGGRTPARLWDELWALYGPDDAGDRPAGRSGGAGRAPDGSGPMLDPESLTILGAARAAALRGTPVAAAIRRAVSGTRPACRDAHVWGELAACFDTAEASGCPLADVLARFARHLEAEADAEAARRTALAGPRATVRLLTWLPVSGLGLGLLLGVDPMSTILGSPWGLTALAAGVGLTVSGRLWSARLVRSAAEAAT